MPAVRDIMLEYFDSSHTYKPSWISARHFIWSTTATARTVSSKSKWMIFCKSVSIVCRFAVNLRYQPQGSDIAFHFNPRINERVVVRNSHLGGSWGHEERDQPSFPFQAGQLFTMIILCEPNEFKVSHSHKQTFLPNNSYLLYSCLAETASIW